MTSLAGSEHQGYNSISNPGQNLGFTCIFSSGVQELFFSAYLLFLVEVGHCLV